MKDVVPMIILLIGIVGYFVRLEVKLAEIKTDLKWIVKNLIKCQQP